MLTYKKPWPIFTMGCFGDAAAASLIIDQTSCLWPATLLAGLNFSCPILLNENGRAPCTERGLDVIGGAIRKQRVSLPTEIAADMCEV